MEPYAWDVDRKDELMVLESSDRKHLLDAVAFGPDGDRLPTAGFKRLEFWDGAVLPAEIVPKPRNAVFYAARGAYLEANRHWESAIVALKQALQLKPRDEQMLRLRAEAFANIERWDEARADFTTALNEDPDNVSLRIERALASIRMGDREMFDRDRVYLVHEAERTKKPQDENEAALLSALPPQPSFDLGPAVQMARDARKAAPQEYTYANTLGAVLYRNGQNRECIKELKAAMKLNQPGTPFDWVFLAMAEARLGLTDESSLLNTEKNAAR